MDQIPRYFESEPKSTITLKGSRHILIRKHFIEIVPPKMIGILQLFDVAVNKGK